MTIIDAATSQFRRLVASRDKNAVKREQATQWNLQLRETFLLSQGVKTPPVVRLPMRDSFASSLESNCEVCMRWSSKPPAGCSPSSLFFSRLGDPQAFPLGYP